MASLVLLLGAIMRGCQNDILPCDWTTSSEVNYETNHNVGNHGNARSDDYVGSIVRKVDDYEDAHVWKIAESCVWPY
ncbi:hypothetical protein FH972_004850 [Carpinus fangiana]|uniref:Uncharacterized protein n=1 Tax=Carpinus fangiana TaxID=176857 RepID=A0A5N6QQS8_9ROSI|nr:hypothetical protein FH972_004850 [Carpinus fangiana]